MVKNLTINGRLKLGFGIMLGLLVLLAAISIYRVNAIEAQLGQMEKLNSVKQRYAINFRGSVHDRAIAVRDVIAVDSDELLAVIANIDQLAANYVASAAPLDAMLTPDRQPDPVETQVLASIKDIESQTLPLVQRVISQRQAGDLAGARVTLLTQARPLFVQWLKQINLLIDFQEKANEAITAQVDDAIDMFQIVIGLLCVMGVTLGVWITRWSMQGVRPLPDIADAIRRIGGGERSVTIPCVEATDEVGQLARAIAIFHNQVNAAEQAKAQFAAEQKMVVDTVSNHLSDLSAGDLTATITTNFPGNYAALKTNFNEALAKLRDLIGSVSESASAIRTGSGEIAQASEDLARRTESNAASLEETAASVTQMDGRLKASAVAASRTVERADQAIATVGGGRAVASEAVQAMGRVSDSAKGIDGVIEGLDKIAFQTRVLAMNAAVEAGRAGDAGRGFAVVADLVSALAMRAEEEAKRARDQLTVTQTDIVTAVEAVTKVDGALSTISGDVDKVHELLATMAADNQVQATAITQISTAIGTMDRATQQNAAMVEETSAAARNLASEVAGLSEQASRFKVGGRVSTTRKAATPPKPRKEDASAYTSSDNPLRIAGTATLVGADDDWNSF